MPPDDRATVAPPRDVQPGGATPAAPLTTFTRDSLVFDVHDAGPRDGAAVILLHGFPQSPMEWDGVVPGLVQAGYRTLTPDQRGYSPGARPKRRRAYRGHELIADVIALADQAGVDRFHLIGHDLGAAVAWGLAMHRPDRLRSLTVVSVPHPAAFRRAALTSSQGLASWYMAFFQLPRVPEMMLASQQFHRFERNLIKSRVPERYASHYTERMRQPGALTGALNWYRGMRPSDGQPIAVATPTLFIYGKNDPFLRMKGVLGTERYVTGPYRLEILERAGHFIPEEDPGSVTELLLRHIANT